MAMMHNWLALDWQKFRNLPFVVPLASLLILSMVNNVFSAGSNSILKELQFSDIKNWQSIDKTDSFQALVRSCNQMASDNRAFSKRPVFGGTKDDWVKVCELAQAQSNLTTPQALVSFFQDNFTPFRVIDPQTPQGLFTGYFEPEVEGSLEKTAEFQIPVYAKPKDLIRFDEGQQKILGFGYGRIKNNKPSYYYTREEIENGALADQGLELLWLKHRADAFFVQIQGSGRVRLPNGKSIRLGYAAKSGLPYTPIGKVLIDQGALEKETVSMQTIRAWLDQNPKKSQAMMWNNKSFVFFRILKNVPDELGPVGAQHVHLTPKTSLAVDRRYWAFGTPVFLNIDLELGSSTQENNWQSLMIAQDTGSAIRGYARGDVFWGSGDQAALTAGKMKAEGEMIVLLPNSLAQNFSD